VLGQRHRVLRNRGGGRQLQARRSLHACGLWMGRRERGEPRAESYDRPGAQIRVPMVCHWANLKDDTRRFPARTSSVAMWPRRTSNRRCEALILFALGGAVCERHSDVTSRRSERGDTWSRIES
jgi:hypothetical protein